MENKKTIGTLGENFANQVLKEKGYKILENNYRCKVGEVDIIALKDGELSFIEVKTRQSLRMGLPCEAVNKEKQRRIRNVARWFLQESHLEEYQVSFQVIEIYINTIENAF